MSRSFNLFRLQQIDSQLDQIKVRLNEIAVLLKEDAAVLRAERSVEENEALYHEARRDLNTAEAKTKAQRIKIEQNSSRLYSGSVSNPKELEDLQKENAALSSYLDTIEERQIEAMLAFEEAETAHQDALKALEQVKAERIEKNAALSGEQSRLSAEKTRLETERTVALVSVKSEDREKYEKLRISRRGIAIAESRSGACSACGNSLNSSLNQASRSPSQLVTCDNCGRILYGGA